jgi:metal-sulfur cluster biosynthetic enzyme
MIDAVLDALREVIDPELDESIVELGFVDHVKMRDSAVEVVLRLPTFLCAPNFAWLMAADARDAVRVLPGIRAVQVRLLDHMYSDEISVGVSCDRAFSATFGEQAEDDDLNALRRIFWVKAFGMRQEQLVRFLQEVGLSAHQIVDLHPSSALPRGAAPLLRTYLERRRRLGISGPWLITDAEGRHIAASELQGYLGRMRKQRVSMTFNSLMCRGLLETRYGLEPARKEDTR